MKKEKKIYVTGDIALDTCIYKGNRKSPEDKTYGSVIRKSKGGAYLLFDFISNTLPLRLASINEQILQASEEKTQVIEEQEIEDLYKKIQKLEEKKLLECCFGFKNEGIISEDKLPSALKTFAFFELKEKCVVPEAFQKVCGEKTDAWKADELIGWGQLEKENNTVEFSYCNLKHKTIAGADILVFDDGGNNFRNAEDTWNKLLFTNPDTKEKSYESEALTQIVLKSAFPLCFGKLFNKLTNYFRNKLTIITSIHEIRKESVLISKGVSWEQTALDLVYELQNNKAISKLLDCKRLIVTLQSEGVLYIQMDDQGEIEKCRLIFDPANLEGEWEESENISGKMFGLMSVFTAAIVMNYGNTLYAEDFDKNVNLEAAITQGLSAMRKYKIVGHGSEKLNPGFPFEKVCEEFLIPNEKFASAFVPIPEKGQKPDEFLSQNWTILQGNYCKAENGEPLFDTAFRFALHGANELINSPYLKVNNWTSYDRREIEAVHNIKNLVSGYLAGSNPERPLSLAVFGMPGSGKSFVVKQFSKALGLPLLEFNLSQYVDFHEMEGSFHQVRDKALEGKVPVVFWDEFDSQQYRWLQYLLAPMQDGKFQAGQITHPIGKSIFVFAGGTSYTFQTFGINKPNKPGSDDLMALQEYKLNMSKYNDFVQKKGPDFKSRLNGYLNILGPNQVEKLDDCGNILNDKNGNVVYDSCDISYPVRRALFTRSLCGVIENQALKIDHGLLNALIRTQRYTHGSRSLEKILSYLKAGQNNKLQRSDLPSLSILNMLVDKDFISLLSVEDPFMFQAYRIAAEIHQNWINIGDKQGWKLEYHKDYDYLPSNMKRENIAAARRIQSVLNALNLDYKLLIVPKEHEDFYEKENFEKTLNDRALLDAMAKAEHEGWVETKRKLGWDFHEKRNDDRKQHNCIIGWDERIGDEVLSDKDKDKDRDAVRNYPKVLSKVGYIIVKNKKSATC